VTTVLVVDDAPDVRFLMKSVLTTAGFDVSEADGGVSALDLLEAGASPDLIVLDVQMPEIDGWETLRRIRATEATRQVPVVLCTVKQHSKDLAQGWELGADGYLGKPFQIADFVAEVKSVLALSPEERLALLEHRRARVQKLDEK
jgi:putative two-component system response regulator